MNCLSGVQASDPPSFYHQPPPELVTSTTPLLFLTEPPIPVPLLEPSTIVPVKAPSSDERSGPVVNYRQRYLQNVGRFLASLYQSTTTTPTSWTDSPRPVRYTLLSTVTEYRKPLLITRPTSLRQKSIVPIAIEFRQDDKVQQQQNSLTEETQAISTTTSFPPLATYRHRETSRAPWREITYEFTRPPAVADLLTEKEKFRQLATEQTTVIPIILTEEVTPINGGEATFSVNVNWEGKIEDLDLQKTEEKTGDRHNLAKIDSSSSTSTSTTTASSSITTTTSSSTTSQTVISTQSYSQPGAVTANLKLNPNRKTFWYNIVIPYPLIKVQQRIGHPVASFNERHHSTVDA